MNKRAIEASDFWQADADQTKLLRLIGGVLLSVRNELRELNDRGAAICCVDRVPANPLTIPEDSSSEAEQSIGSSSPVFPSKAPAPMAKSESREGLILEPAQHRSPKP